jgi:hypothetical protein
VRCSGVGRREGVLEVLLKFIAVFIRPQHLPWIDGVLIDRRGIVLVRHDDPRFHRANVATGLRVPNRRNGYDSQRLSQRSWHGRFHWLKKQGRIVEAAAEARQAEPGPSILLVLIVSVGSAAAMLGAVRFVFFRTYDANVDDQRPNGISLR